MNMHSFPGHGSAIRWCAGLLALFLFFVCSATALASTVHIYDNAKVLNASQVQSEAANLPYPIDIYTVANFTGTRAQFQQETAKHTASDANLLVMAIDTDPGHHYIYIKGGSNVPLSSSQATDAANAFASNFSSGGYTGATIAALRSLNNALSAAGNTPANNGAAPVPAPRGGFNWLALPICCVGLLILLGLGAFFLFRGRSRRRFNQEPRIDTGYNQPYGGPYNQGPYNQGYPPYGPVPGPRQGMNPWAAGGLGAAAGGLAGYELGKEAGERERQEQDNNQNDWGGSDPNAGNFGGGGGADFGSDPNAGNFGGGGGADFGGGGGNDNSGGGSNF